MIKNALTPLLLLSAAYFTFTPASIMAAPKGVTISPAIQQITVNADQTEADSDINITNNTDQTMHIDLSIVDFGTLDENGGLFLSGQPNDFERKYGLANWAKLDRTQIALSPRQSDTETVRIINSPTLASGGHYAAILVKDGASSISSSATTVELKPIVTQLIFARKTGGERYALSLKDLNYTKTRFGFIGSADLKFNNTGNVHLVPRGIVHVIDPSGREVGQGIINENSNIILPENIRRFPVKINKTKALIWPGKYSVEVDYRYDGRDTTSTASYSVIIAPPKSIALVGLAALILLAVPALIFNIRRKRNFR